MNAASAELFVVVEATSLPALAADINAALGDFQRQARASVASALRTGALLTQAKALVPHGEWEGWITANCACSLRTAQTYMRLHAKMQALPEPEKRNAALLPLRQAIASIAAAEQPKPAGYRERDHAILNRQRASFESACRSLRSVGADVGRKRISAERIKTLRERLTAIMAELDSMAEKARA